MAKKGSKALLVIGSFVVIGGVLAYFLFFRTRKKGQEGTGETPPTTGDSSAYTPTPSVSTSSSSSQYSFPFKTTEEGNKFRKWVNDNYPQWAKDNKLDVSGSLNSYVEKAWKQYGDVYNKYVLNPTANTTSTTSTPEKKVEIRLKNGSKLYRIPDASPNNWLVEFGSGSDVLKLSWIVKSSNMRVSPQGYNMFKISIPVFGKNLKAYEGWVALRDTNWKYV